MNAELRRRINRTLALVEAQLGSTRDPIDDMTESEVDAALQLVNRRLAECEVYRAEGERRGAPV